MTKRLPAVLLALICLAVESNVSAFQEEYDVYSLHVIERGNEFEFRWSGGIWTIKLSDLPVLPKDCEEMTKCSDIENNSSCHGQCIWDMEIMGLDERHE